MSSKSIDAIEPKLLFPTVIREFQLEGFDADLDELKEKILKVEADSRPTYDTNALNWQTDDFLHKQPSFKQLVDIAYQCSKEYADFMGYHYDDLVVHEMWANVYRRDESLHMHSHPNSFISGCFYLTDGSEIEFYDPKTEVRSIIQPGQENNFFNTFSMAFPAQKGKLIMFPSWLKHAVMHQPEGVRVSVAFNVMLQGKIGSRFDKTYANFGSNPDGVKGEVKFEDDLL